MSTVNDTFDELLKPTGPAALVYIEKLSPVEGHDAIFFPPTFAKPQAEKTSSKDKEGQYDINDMPGGTKRCTVDTRGSQANRVEPLFKDRYADLVPQIVVKIGDHEVNLLDAGHRAADAIIRFSEVGKVLSEVFTAAKKGDLRPLAKIAPTSIVFGMWDSRGNDEEVSTMLKRPRLFTSLIDAYDVAVRTRSAQYTPPVRYKDTGVIKDPDKVFDAMSSVGMNDVPSTGKLGGVQLMPNGEIRNTRTLNLITLRTIEPGGKDGEATRRYILGLALLAATAPRDYNLRQGCLLVRKEGDKPQFVRVYSDGRRDPIPLDPEAVLAYARDAAKTFGVGESRTAKFSDDTANKTLHATKKKGE